MNVIIIFNYKLINIIIAIQTVLGLRNVCFIIFILRFVGVRVLLNILSMAIVCFSVILVIVIILLKSIEHGCILKFGKTWLVIITSQMIKIAFSDKISNCFQQRRRPIIFFRPKIDFNKLLNKTKYVAFRQTPH